MTKAQYNTLKKQIDKLLDKLIQQAEKEALEEGIDISSPEFEEIILVLKKKVLASKGLTLEEYEKLEKDIEEEEEMRTEDVTLRLLAVNLKKDQKRLSEAIKAFEEEPTKKAIKELRGAIDQVQKNQLTEKDVKKLIPKLPKIKDYEEDIKKLGKRISGIKIPEQIDNTEEIHNLEWQLSEDIKKVEAKIPKIKDWSKELKKLEKELREYVDMAAIPKGRVGRDHGYGDAGSFDKAILDSRYLRLVGGVLTGAVEAADHGAAAIDQIVNVCYGTGSPPAALTVTEGALFIKYTP